MTTSQSTAPGRFLPAPRRRPRAAPASAGRIRAVDGLRALAVLAVMGFHFKAGPGGGFLGVDLFFVISGFVITRLLLTEKERGALSLRGFYLRRVRRLLPAFLAVLGAVQLWLWTASLPGMRTTANAQALASLGFAGNWYAVFAHVGYWSVRPDQAPLNHLWSLAVEEQFYLVWPALLLLATAHGRGRRTLAVVAGALAVLSYALAAHLYIPGAPDRAYLGTDTRAGALCLGALAACLVPCAQRRYVPAPQIRAAASLAVLAALWFSAGLGQPALHSWQLPVAGLAGAVLVHALAVLDGRPEPAGSSDAPEVRSPVVARVLGSGPLTAVGAISYGLYLWHWPVWVWLNAVHPEWSQPARQGVAWAASFALACVSYAVLEKPARRCSARLLLPAVAVAYAALLPTTLVASAPVHPSDGGTPVVTGEAPGGP